MKHVDKFFRSRNTYPHFLCRFLKMYAAKSHPCALQRQTAENSAAIILYNDSHNCREWILEKNVKKFIFF